MPRHALALKPETAAILRRLAAQIRGILARGKEQPAFDTAGQAAAIYAIMMMS